MQGGGMTDRITVVLSVKDSLTRREIIYCKRAILSLSSSKILTPYPPLRLASVSSPPTKAGGTHSPGGEGDGGMGVNILEDERDRIALLQ
jgi:hypothetical protein